MGSSSNYSHELKQKFTEIYAMILPENITTAPSKQKQKYEAFFILFLKFHF